MKYRFIPFILILVTGCDVTVKKEQALTRESINEDWLFTKSADASHSNLVNLSFDSTVDLPHTWNTQDVLDETPGYYRGTAWYKKVVTHRPLAGKERLYLEFEAANQEAWVYVNGKEAGTHQGGYTTFRMDVTDYLDNKSDSFTLEVAVSNEHNRDIPPLSADFTFFGGMYRDAWLVYVPPVHLSLDHFGGPGIYWQTPEVSADRAIMHIFGFASNVSGKKADCEIVYTITDPDGHVIASRTVMQQLETGRNIPLNKVEFEISTPKLWSVDTPARYVLEAMLRDRENGVVYDRRSVPVGFRYFDFDSVKGFSLNGKSMKIRGISRHQDYPGLGNALTPEHHTRDMQLIREMGANFLRVAHYPQDQDVLNQCDTLGILTSVEIPIVNRITESEAFTGNCMQMMQEMIWQNYNHPSVIMWTYMNEVLLRLPYTDEDSLATYYQHVAGLAGKLENLARESDPYRVTMIPNHGAFDRYNDAGITAIPMVVGWNLYQGWYGSKFDKFGDFLDMHHELLPDKPLLVTEYGAGHDPRLVSDAPVRFDFTSEYAMQYHKSYLEDINERDFVAGGIIWILNDFSSEGRGDAVPHINNKGICSVDRKPKETYWFYKSRWSSEPFIQIQPSFEGIVCGNGNEKDEKGVTRVYSNQAEISVLLNGMDQGDFRVQDGMVELLLPFRPGKNELVVADPYSDMAEKATLQFFSLGGVLHDFSEDRSLYISCGDHRWMYDQPSGVLWVPDQVYTAGRWGYSGGIAYTVDTRHGTKPSSDVDITGTQADPVYQTQRVAPERYRFTVPRGEYEVTLLFSELTAESGTTLVYNLGDDPLAGEEEVRVFGVSINGKKVIDALNIQAEAGVFSALDKTFNVQVGPGNQLEILFHPVTGKPVISGIVIRDLHGKASNNQG